MKDSGYQRLLRLSRAGDADAAWSLQSEARRRGDAEALVLAVDALDAERHRELLAPCWAGRHLEALLRCARSCRAFAYLRALAAVWPERHVDILAAGGFESSAEDYADLVSRVKRVNAALMSPHLLVSHVVVELLRAAEQGGGHRVVGEPRAGLLDDRYAAEVACARTARQDAVVLDLRRLTRSANGYAPGTDWVRPSLAMTTNPAELRRETERWCGVRGRMRQRFPMRRKGGRCLDHPTRGTLAELRWLSGPRGPLRVAHLSAEMTAAEISAALDELGSWLEVRFDAQGALEVCDSSPSVFHYGRFIPHQAEVQPRLLEPGAWRRLRDGAALEAGRVRVHLRYVVDVRITPGA